MVYDEDEEYDDKSKILVAGIDLAKNWVVDTEEDPKNIPKIAGLTDRIHTSPLIERQGQKKRKSRFPLRFCLLIY